MIKSILLKTTFFSIVAGALIFITSCSDSSNDSSSNNGESPVTLEGKTLEGVMHVDYKTGDGFERESRNFIFDTSTVKFEEIGTDENEKEEISSENGHGTYVFQKITNDTGTLKIETKFVSYEIILTFFNNNKVTAAGTMIEIAGPQDILPAKGDFIIK